MRGLLADGFNSFCHMLLGLLAAQVWLLVPVFLLYQLLHPNDPNFGMDCIEFVCGYCIGFVTLP